MMQLLKRTAAGALRALLPRPVWESLWVGYRHWLSERAIAAERRANRAVVDQLCRGSDPIRLELGAGTRKLAGWTTVDHNGQCDITMTLADPLPLPDATVEELYASHVFEHFHHPELMRLLAECRRVLKPGGRLRLAVPDAALYVRDYLARDMSHLSSYITEREGYFIHSPIDVVNLVAYDRGAQYEHGYLFDREGVLAVLKLAGFQRCAIREFDPSIDLENRRANSLFAEAVR